MRSRMSSPVRDAFAATARTVARVAAGGAAATVIGYRGNKGDGSAKSKLGFVSIGYIGRPIAQRLLRSDFRLTAYDRRRTKTEELIRFRLRLSRRRLAAGPMCALFYLGAGAAEVGGKSAPQHTDVGGQDQLVKTHVDHARNLRGRYRVHGRGDSGGVARLDDPA